MPMYLEAVALSDPGKVHEINEDRAFQQIFQSSEDDAIGLFIVADGMGGHLAGEVASHWAVETLRRELADLFVPPDPRETMRLSGEDLRALAPEEGEEDLRPSERILRRQIRSAVQRANEAVYGYALHRPDEAMGTGSTLTMAVVKDRVATIVNIGDSRTYLLRDSTLHQLTKDHSVVAALVEAGEITPEEARIHPQRSLITRCLGYMATVEIDMFRQELRDGDLLLLCSDGLWELVDDHTIVEIIEQAPTLKAAAQQLIDRANEAGGDDNISVVLVQVRE